MKYFDLLSSNYKPNFRRENMNRRRRGKYLKRRRRCNIFPLALGIIILGIMLFTGFTSYKVHNFLIADQVTVEAFSSSDDRDYDYQHADIGFLGKFSIPLFYQVTDEVHFKTPGSYQITYKAKLPFMKDHIHTVTIVDTTPPEIYLEAMDVEVLQDIDDFVEPGFYAEDICDGKYLPVEKTITKSSPYWYTITYTVCDHSGNQAQISREVNVIRGSVALTFDDGPSLNITPQILDLLEQNNVPATFFIIGFGSNKEDIVLREFTDGHTIGYHGMSHEYASIYSSLETLMANFSSLEEKVEALTGYSSHLVRFPGGSSNTVSFNYCDGIMTEAAKKVESLGYTYYDWNVDSGDAGSAKNADEIYHNVTSGILPGRFNVVLMHDSSGKEETFKALQGIIDYCLENDYQLVRLDSQSPKVTHKIAN